MTETLLETPRRWSFSLEASTVNPDGVRAACSRALVRRPGTFISRSYSGDDLRAHFVVGCVDTRAARAAIRDAVGKWSTVSYWLDLGNNADSGQFILGEPLSERNRRAKLRLRSAAEILPEIVDPNLDNDREPSCSSAEALERQELFVNSTLAQHALALLARLFRYGTVCYHGGFISLSTGVSSRLPIDASLWRRLRQTCAGGKAPSARTCYAARRALRCRFDC